MLVPYTEFYVLLDQVAKVVASMGLCFFERVKVQSWFVWQLSGMAVYQLPSCKHNKDTLYVKPNK